MTPGIGRVLILSDTQRHESAGGILLPEDRWTQDTTGTVVAVGRGPACAACDLPTEPQVHPNDHVVFSYQHGQPITLNGTEYLMMHQGDILAVLED